MRPDKATVERAPELEQFVRQHFRMYPCVYSSEQVKTRVRQYLKENKPTYNGRITLTDVLDWHRHRTTNYTYLLSRITSSRRRALTREEHRAIKTFVNQLISMRYTLPWRLD